MDKQQEQGLFNQIEEVLHSYEEGYEAGAWEEFDANRNKNKRKWPLYAWTAAAIVLLVASFGLYESLIKNEAQNVKSIVKVNKDHNQVNDGKLERTEEDNAFIQNELPSTILPQRMIVATKNSTPETLLHENQESKVENTSVVSENVAIIPNSLDNGKNNVRNAITSGLVSAGAYDSLMNAKRLSPLEGKSSSKFTYSLVVSPSMSNEKMNFGAGMELSYSLNNNFSINSGLMYTTLNAKSEGETLTNSGNYSTTTNSSQTASLAVAGIELPLAIQYQTNGGFYATAGISAVNLIRDKLEYSFSQESTVSHTLYAGGVPQEILKVVSERKTERSIEPIRNNMGFFNFSAGKKQSIGNTNFNLGPFVKVPFSSVSTERIKLLQAGIKISVDF